MGPHIVKLYDDYFIAATCRKIENDFPDTKIHPERVVKGITVKRELACAASPFGQIKTMFKSLKIAHRKNEEEQEKLFYIAFAIHNVNVKY